MPENSQLRDKSVSFLGLEVFLETTELIKEIEAEIEKSTEWKAVKDTHLTTLFVGKLPIIEYKPQRAYQEFCFDKEELIESRGAVYVPGGLVAIQCSTDCYSANQHPHITLATDELSAVESNYALSVFLDKPEVLNSLKISQKKVFEGNYKDKPAYFIIFGEPKTFKGKHKIF